ncbi:MAG: hypothetical protein ACI8ZM_001566 [Crocinitomix sp.]|jgi:hypothetical protein
MKLLITVIILLFNSCYSQDLLTHFPSVNGTVNTLCLYGNTLYIGGEFTDIEGIPRKNFAAINALTGEIKEWAPKANNAVYHIDIGKGVVYAAGKFTTINGIARNTLGAIDASTGETTIWNPIVTCPIFDGEQIGNVNSVSLYRDTLYIAGYFTAINGVPKNNLAGIKVSDGTLSNWSPETTIPTYHIRIYKSKAYVSGGMYLTESDDIIHSFAKIDLETSNINNWEPLNTNCNPTAPITGHNDNLFISGPFSEAGGMVRNGVAKVNNSSGNAYAWDPQIGSESPLNSGVKTIAVNSDNVFLGGSFKSDILETLGDHLLAYDYNLGEVKNWTPNPNDDVNIIETNGDMLYVGGKFTLINEIEQSGLAVFNTAILNLDSYKLNNSEKVKLYPNPANSKTSIDFAGNHVTSIKIYNLIGELIQELNYEQKTQQQLTIDVSNFPNGQYYVIIINEYGTSISTKLSVIHSNYFS